MIIENSKIYKGSQLVKSVYLGNKQIKYNMQPVTFVDIETIWVNVIAPNVDIIVKNLSVYRADGTTLSYNSNYMISDFNSFVYSTDKVGNDYIKSHQNIVSFVFPQNSLNLKSNSEAGFIINFSKEEPVSKVEIEIIVASGNSKDVTLELSRINNYVSPPANGPMIDTELLFSQSGIHLENAWSASTKYEMIPVLLPKADAPNVTADDENNVIVGLNNTMEYSLDDKVTWVKYTGSNAPNIGDVNKKVYVRTFATDTHLASDIIELTFTKAVSGNVDLIKKLWINTIASFNGNDMYFRKLTLYREDGTTLVVNNTTNSEVTNAVSLKRENLSGDYSITAINPYSLSVSVDGVNVYYGRETGVLVILKKEEPIVRLTIDIKSGDNVTRTVDVEIRKVIGDSGVIASDINNSILLFKKVGFVGTPSWSANTILDANIVQKPKATTPTVTADDENNTIVGLTTDMEYSLDNKATWIKYTGSNAPNIGNSNKYVFVRVAETDTHLASDEVELYFTVKPVSSGGSKTIKNLWINAISSASGVDYYIRNLKVYREDGTALAAADITYVVQTARTGGTGNYNRTIKSKTSLLSASAALNVSGGAEVGCLVTFANEESVIKITAEIRAFSAGGVRNVKVEFSKVDNYTHALTPIDLTGANNLYTEDPFRLLAAWADECTITASFGTEKPKESIPAVTADNDNNTIIGLTSSMSYSLDNKVTWTRYTGNNPPNIGNNDITVYVKTLALTEDTVDSDAVALVFTRSFDKWVTVNNIIIEFEPSSIGANMKALVKNLKIRKSDGSYISIADIANKFTGSYQTGNVLTTNSFSENIFTITGVSVNVIFLKSLFLIQFNKEVDISVIDFDWNGYSPNAPGTTKYKVTIGTTYDDYTNNPTSTQEITYKILKEYKDLQIQSNATTTSNIHYDPSHPTNEFGGVLLSLESISGRTIPPASFNINSLSIIDSNNQPIPAENIYAGMYGISSITADTIEWTGMIPAASLSSMFTSTGGAELSSVSCTRPLIYLSFDRYFVIKKISLNASLMSASATTEDVKIGFRYDPTIELGNGELVSGYPLLNEKTTTLSKTSKAINISATPGEDIPDSTNAVNNSFTTIWINFIGQNDSTQITFKNFSAYKEDGTKIADADLATDTLFVAAARMKLNGQDTYTSASKKFSALSGTVGITPSIDPGVKEAGFFLRLKEETKISRIEFEALFNPARTETGELYVNNIVGNSRPTESSPFTTVKHETVTVDGTAKLMTISFASEKPKADPPAVTADDDNNVIVGLTNAMEYSLDNTAWTKYDGTNPPNIGDADITIYVRVAETSTTLASDSVTLVFTKAPAQNDAMPIDMKALLITTIANVGTLDMWMRNVKIYTSDGTILGQNDIEFVVGVKRGGQGSYDTMSGSTNGASITGLITQGSSGNGSNLYTAVEVGCVFKFKELKEISKVEVELRGYDANNAKTVTVKMYHIDNYTGGSPALNLMHEFYSLSNFDLKNAWEESSKVQAVISTREKPKAETPLVTVDDINNTVVGLDDTMEYSFDNINWIKYVGNNPPDIGNRTIDVHVRVARSSTNRPSDTVSLSFTQNINPNAPKNATTRMLWINTSSDTNNTDFFVRNVKIYRTDETVITEYDINNIALTKKANFGAQYVFGSVNVNDLFVTTTTGNGADLFSGIEVGCIIVFKKDEEIYKVEMEAKAYSQSVVKTVRLDLCKVNSYGNGSIDYDTLVSMYDVNLGVAWDSNSARVLNMDPRPKVPAPSVTADDTNNVITGLTTDMEYSLDNAKNWVKYTGTNQPDIGNRNRKVYVRVAETSTTRFSDHVELTFTRVDDGILDTKALMVNNINVNASMDMYARNLKIYRQDGTIISENDIERIVQIKSSNGTSYASTVQSIPGFTNITIGGNGVNLYAGNYIGFIVEFKNFETINRLSVDMKAYNRQQVNTMAVEVSSISYYEYSDVVGPIIGTVQLILREEAFVFAESWSTASTFDRNLLLKPKAEAPNVTVDDINDVVTGLDDTM